MGGVAGTVLGTMGPTTASGTGQTDKEFHVRGNVVCLTTGASGTWFAEFHEMSIWTPAGSVAEMQIAGSNGAIHRTTTPPNHLVHPPHGADRRPPNTPEKARS